MKIVMIGDIGGHASAFNHMLNLANVKNYHIKSNLCVIQMGDLVHKGPQSDECVRIAQRLIENNPDNYIQLYGNHDDAYHNGTPVHGRSGVVTISSRSQDMLKDFKTSRKVFIAYAHDNILFTHAGLTYGLWKQLGSPSTAKEAAHILNTMWYANNLQVTQPGVLYTGQINLSAGVTWAHTTSELILPWMTHSMPFSQYHGHQGTWYWENETRDKDLPLPIKINFNNKNGTTDVKIDWHHKICCVDWHLGKQIRELDFTDLPSI